MSLWQRQVSSKDTNMTHKKKQHNWKHSHFVACFFILLLFCFSIAIFLKVHYSPDACVNEFIEALENDNYHTIKELITCEGVAINNDTLQPFLDLYHEDKQFRHDIKKTLGKDLANVNLDTYKDKYWIQLIAHRKFFIKTYTIRILPVKVTLSTNLDPVTVEYANTTVTVTNDVPMEPVSVLPGNYEFLATYYDTTREKEQCIRRKKTILTDVTLPLDFDYATLSLEIPNGYSLDSITADGARISPTTTESFIYAPIFPDEVITLVCLNSRGKQVTTTFTIKDEYMNSTYHHVCDFNVTSMEFTYQKGLTVTKLSINNKPVKKLSKYVDAKTDTIYFPNLKENTVIKTSLEAPWGERFTDTYTVTSNSFKDYYHSIECKQSKETITSILTYATKYYFALYEALNTDDIDLLRSLSEEDEVANEFTIMLENIEYDYDLYSDLISNYEEDLLMKPTNVMADYNDLRYYRQIYKLKIRSKVKSTITSTDLDLLTPKIESSQDDHSIILHIGYDYKKKRWVTTGNYIDYDGIPLVNPIKLQEYK